MCGSVDVGLGVPIARDQKHVFTDVNPGFMDLERRAGPGVDALHVNITEVRRRFIGWDVCVETDDLPTSPQGSEVVALDGFPGLFLPVSLATVKENMKRTVWPRGRVCTKGIARD